MRAEECVKAVLRAQEWSMARMGKVPNGRLAGGGLAGDGAGDRLDGARAAEVTAVFGDSVLFVRHLGASAQGQGGAVPRALLWSAAASLAVFGLVAVLGARELLVAIGLLGITALVAIYRTLDQRSSAELRVGPSDSADLPVACTALAPGMSAPMVRSREGRIELLLHPTLQGSVALDAGGVSHEPKEIGRWGQGNTDKPVDGPPSPASGVGRRTVQDFRGSDLAGRLLPLDAFVHLGGAQAVAESPGWVTVPLPDMARVEISLGRHALLIQSVVAPAPLAKTGLWGRMRWREHAFVSASAGAHLVILAMIMAIPQEGLGLSRDNLGADNKFVRYLIKPPVEEAPPELFRQPAGGGAAHRGPQGAAGNKEAPKRRRRMQIKGPATGRPLVVAPDARQLAQEQGLFKVLDRSAATSARLRSLFSQADALSGEATEAMGQLEGQTLGEAYGEGGLGVIGSGRGGGDGIDDGVGFAKVGAIGSGLFGGPGGRRGLGKWGRLRPRGALKAPPPVIGMPKLVGCLDRSVVRRYVRRKLNEVKHCYEKGLLNHRNLRGRIVVGFAIERSGRVVASTVRESTLGDTETERCVAGAIRRIAFPSIECGLVQVRYPFVFNSPRGN